MRWTVLLLLAGCIKSPDPLGFAGGGTDVKESNVIDTGDSGDTGGGSTEGPVITSFDVYFEDGGNLGVVITGKIAYTDTPDDDVVGGSLFFQLAEGSGDPTQYTLDIVAPEDLNGSEQAYQDPDTLELVFGVQDVDTDTDYTFTEVQLKDNSGNTSEPVEGTVAAGSYTGE